MTLPAGEVESAGVDVLLFEVGDSVFGVDAAQVLQIGHALSTSFALAGLGRLSSGKRALSFLGEGGLPGQLRVDAVHGVKTVSVDALRKMPLPTGAHPYAIGFWLNGEKPVLLIDLREGMRFHGRQ